MENTAPGMCAPMAVNVTVGRSARPRVYLPEREIEKLIKAAGENRWGHRDATAILIAYRSRGIDELNATVGLSAGLKVEMTIAELAAAYEVAHWGATNVPGSGTAIDLYGGVRAWWQSADACGEDPRDAALIDIERSPWIPCRDCQQRPDPVRMRPHSRLHSAQATHQRLMRATHKRSELPLSAAQLGIWFAQELAPSSTDFNSAEYVEILGPVDPAIFETALRRVVAEADVLTVRFVKYAEGPRQVIGDPPNWPLSFIDVSAEPYPLAAARVWMDADRARPIDLLHAPLFAYTLFKAAPDRFYWYARYHHILLDALGRWLIASRLAHVYSALATGLRPDDNTLGSLSVLLEDDDAYRASNDFVSDRQYWLKALADHPEPTGISTRPFVVSNGFMRADGYVPHSTVVQLRAIAPGVSLPRIITAAIAMFVYLMTRAEDLVLGLQVAARVNPATQNVPGMATNLVPVRVTVRPDMSVSECIRQTAEQIREVLRHQRYRIADLRRDLGRVGDDRPICTPLVNFMPFDYNFVYSGYRTSTHNLSPGPVENLSIRIYDSSDGNDLLMSFDANPALYDSDALIEHQQRFLRLLSALTDPDAAVGRLDFLAPAERRRLLEWNGTQADYPRENASTNFLRSR
jgi:nonribosomal peptide synthetase DhbF